MIKAVIFDFIDVLVDGGLREAYRHFEKELGMSAEEATNKVIGSEYMIKSMKGELTYNEFVEEIARDLGVDVSLVKKMGDFMLETTQLKPEVMEVVKRLHGKYKLAILSDHLLGRFELMVERFDLEKYFDLIYNSAKLGTIKAEREAFKMMVKELNVKPEECVFIDDRKVNIEVADSLGFKTIHYVKGTDLKKELREHGVDI